MRTDFKRKEGANIAEAANENVKVSSEYNDVPMLATTVFHTVVMSLLSFCCVDITRQRKID